MKKCPSCAEFIKAEAKKCRYCGEEQLFKAHAPYPELGGTSVADDLAQFGVEPLEFSQALKLVIERKRVSQDLFKSQFGSSARATNILSLLEVKEMIHKPEGTNRWEINIDMIESYLKTHFPEVPIEKEEEEEAEKDSVRDTALSPIMEFIAPFVAIGGSLVWMFVAWSLFSDIGNWGLLLWLVGQIAILALLVFSLRGLKSDTGSYVVDAAIGTAIIKAICSDKEKKS